MSMVFASIRQCYCGASVMFVLLLSMPSISGPMFSIYGLVVRSALALVRGCVQSYVSIVLHDIGVGNMS